MPSNQELAFGRAALELGLIELEELLDASAESGAPGAPTLPRVLVNRGHMTAEQAADVVQLSDDRPEAAGLRGSRYRLGPLLGKGANGSVLLAGDDRLGRKIALKLHSKGADLSAIELNRFCHEAQVTGQLAHPSIVPVHDLGLLPDGRPYYTMKRVEGTTLKDVLDSLRRREDRFEGVWTVPHTASVVLRVAQALAYAHDRGVVHRDVKPANIMIGGYGEVLLLDWGVARVLGQAVEGQEEVATWRSEGDEDRTIVGTIAGTPAYMAPEQARGDIDLIGPASDVYSVGVVLYEYVARRRPFTARDVRELLHKVVTDPVASPSLIEGARRVPDELEALIMRCVEKDPADRFPNGQALAEALEAFIEGSRRRAQAAELSERANRKSTAYVKAAESALDAEQQIRGREAQLPPWARAEDRRPLWQAEERWRELRRVRDDSYDDAISLYQAALEHLPENDEARAGLASLYLRRMDEAERRGESGAARFFRSQVLRHDPDVLGRLLEGHATLNLAVDPPDAQVTIRPLSTQDRVLKPGRSQRATPESLASLAVPRGSWLVEVRAPGHVFTTLALHVDRPIDIAIRLSLPAEGEVASGFSYVPPGPWTRGGDARALDSVDRSVQWTEGFAIAQHPVTVGAFNGFLADRGNRDGFGCWTGPEGLADEERDRLPALGVSFPGALAYAAWATAQTGRAFRLPTHDQWEKAARGADGRAYPWGESWDPGFCNNRDAERGQARPRAVGSFPEDCSVYGVSDLAGGVSEWVLGDVPHRPDRGWLRGGNWNDHSQRGRICSRTTAPRSTRGGTIGFRLVEELRGS
jgi:eukaryotic-like serine/threonine-protein kinase